MAVLNGASGEISLGNRGRVDIHLTVRGAPCHSGMPWAGANAVTGGAELVRRLAARFDSGAPHPELGRKTLTATHIRSFPDSTHTVQERCELTLDRRLLPGEEPEAAFDRVMETAREIESFNDPVSGRPFAVEGRIGAFMYPSLVEPDAPLVQALQRASVALTGARAPTRYSPTAFDQGYLNHVGIPAVNFGAGEPRFAHTDFDMASVERTVVACQVYCYAVIERLGQ
jgi:acetylornithine deacetylase